MGGEYRTVWTVGKDATGRDRLSVAAAAAELGTTVEAIRKRVQRETIEHERDEAGHVWILLDADRTRPDTGQDAGQTQSDTASLALISEMRGRIEDLREQLEAERQGHAEARRLLLRALERIPPALEAPESPEPRPSEARPGTTDAGGEAQEGSERPWWRFWLGG